MITSQRPRVSALSDVAHRDARAPRPAPTHLRTRPSTYLDEPSCSWPAAGARCRLLVHAKKQPVLSEARGCEQYERFHMHRRGVSGRAERRQPPGGPPVAAEHSHTSTSRVSYLTSLSRVSNPLSCAAPPAPLARAGRTRAAHVFAACRPRRAPSAACYIALVEAGVCSSALLSRANDRLVFGRIRLGDVHGRHEKFEEYTKKYKQPLLEP